MGRLTGIVGFFLALALFLLVIAAAIATGVLPLPGNGVAIGPSPTPTADASPPAAASPTPDPTAEPTPSPAGPATPGPSPGGTHVVRTGDTLFGIGELYGVPWALIAEANEILPPDYVIQVGQTLVIPLPGESPEGPPTYVVQPGDTITGIAFELGVDPTELADLNELENWDEIYAGQVLLVPGDWQQQESPAP